MPFLDLLRQARGAAAIALFGLAIAGCAGSPSETDPSSLSRQMFEAGFGIPQVAVVSGHKSWNHLKRYTQIKPASLHDHGKHPDTPPRPDSPPTAARRRGKSES